MDKKIVLPLLMVGMGAGYYFYVNSVGDKSVDVISKDAVKVVEAEQLQVDGNSRTLDWKKEKPKARNMEGKEVALDDMSDEMKDIVGRLRGIEDELGDYLSKAEKEQKVMMREDAKLDSKLALLDAKLEKINKKEGIDGEVIKSEIVAMREAPISKEDMPIELAESLDKTDAELLKLEESLDKIQEEM